MTNTMTHLVVYFWQRIVSPHMAGLASALSDIGHDVTYVAEQPMSEDRAALGWEAPSLRGARLEYAPDRDAMIRLARAAPANCIHICQGLRGNGLVGSAQKELVRRGAEQWVVMETVENSGWRGMLRRLEYRRLISSRRRSVAGYLATGHETRDWLIHRSADARRVFPFAYFLADHPQHGAQIDRTGQPFRFLFVGQFIELKRLDLLIDAIARLGQRPDIELTVIGSGPLEHRLLERARGALGSRVRWLGRQKGTEIPHHMAAADCLVLPSRYDGWGAVVSEALMAGTPAVCSDKCGSAAVVRHSPQGGVFPAGDLESLTALLRHVVDQGQQTADGRARLASWASSLGASAGADYLSQILACSRDGGNRPTEPWTTEIKNVH